jgi:hypothetical protein
MGIHLYPIDNAIPPTVGQHPQPIVLKVSKTVCATNWKNLSDHLHSLSQLISAGQPGYLRLRIATPSVQMHTGPRSPIFGGRCDSGDRRSRTPRVDRLVDKAVRRPEQRKLTSALP